MSIEQLEKAEQRIFDLIGTQLDNRTVAEAEVASDPDGVEVRLMLVENEKDAVSEAFRRYRNYREFVEAMDFPVEWDFSDDS